MVLVVFLLSCARAPEAPPVAQLAVVVPLAGSDAEAGRAVIEGARFAAGFSVDLLIVDEAEPDAIARIEENLWVFAAIAHVSARSAQAHLDTWRASGLPVIVAAPGSFEGIPRVVPPPDRAARCARQLAEPGSVVRVDAASMATGQGVAEAVGTGRVEVIDGAAVAAQAGKEGTAPVVWAGTPTAGGNYLRALRQLGSSVSFLAIGSYGPLFLASAWKYSEGAAATSVGRVAGDPAFVRTWIVRHGGQRAGLRQALAGVEALGASGAMRLDSSGVVSPVRCARFFVQSGAFTFDQLLEERG